MFSFTELFMLKIFTCIQDVRQCKALKALTLWDYAQVNMDSLEFLNKIVLNLILCALKIRYLI